MVKESSTQIDGLLAPWLQMVRTRDDEAAESELALLIEAHIEPVIRSSLPTMARPPIPSVNQPPFSETRRWSARRVSVSTRTPSKARPTSLSAPALRWVPGHSRRG